MGRTLYRIGTTDYWTELHSLDAYEAANRIWLINCIL